jgi:hypothetical protein
MLKIQSQRGDGSLRSVIVTGTLSELGQTVEWFRSKGLYLPFHRCATDSRAQTLAAGPCRLQGLIIMNDGFERVYDSNIPPAAFCLLPNNLKCLFL